MWNLLKDFFIFIFTPKMNAIDRLKEIFQSDGTIRVVTHIDTDGLTSASIFISLLQHENQNFWLTTVKQLDDEVVDKLMNQLEKQKWKAVFFLDLGSSKLAAIKKFSKYTNAFVIDHHEIRDDDASDCENFFLVNPSNYSDERLSASSLTYLFVRDFDKNKYKKLSQLAVIGMIGDILDKNIGKNMQSIIEDAKETGMQIKKGLTVFSALRPIHKALEFSSSLFIPGVTGSQNGAVSLLEDLGIDIKDKNGYRTLLDLSKEETSKLITAILLRRVNQGKDQNIIDNIYLVKMMGHLRDAREISAMTNACGRLGYSSLAVAFLLNSKKAHSKIEDVYSKYKHHIVKSLNWVNSTNTIIKGSSYVIVDAKDKIKDTIIGTIISILSSSYIYNKGTVIIGMSYRRDNKIKVSARIVKDKGEDSDINLERLLSDVIKITGGEIGGHRDAAGCIISKSKEQIFIDTIKKNLSVEEIKINA